MTFATQSTTVPFTDGNLRDWYPIHSAAQVSILPVILAPSSDSSPLSNQNPSLKSSKPWEYNKSSCCLASSSLLPPQAELSWPLTPLQPYTFVRLQSSKTQVTACYAPLHSSLTHTLVDYHEPARGLIRTLEQLTGHVLSPLASQTHLQHDSLCSLSPAPLTFLAAICKPCSRSMTHSFHP